MREIEIKYCRACGQLESMHSMLNNELRQNVIRVGCLCGAAPVRETVLSADEPYMLNIETRKEEAASDADSNPGDVPAGGEAGREGDV